MELSRSKVRRLVGREQEKYIRLYQSDENYGNDRHNRTATHLRGNDNTRKVIHKILKKSSSLLDVGCGKGFHTRYFQNTYPKLSVSCVDIAGKTIMKYEREMEIIQASANNLPFEDNSFDIVIHIDGMEHIPSVIEEAVLLEELRVSKRYIYHQIATKPTTIDDERVKMGLEMLHVNLRTEEEWKNMFSDFVKKNNLKSHFFICRGGWVHILLGKRRLRWL